ncbi:MAG: hypothetical protein H7Y59_15665 [Anaerolineales bacterium]|nr:hypothetical protein [Anaerolineales bacterium]
MQNRFLGTIFLLIMLSACSQTAKTSLPVETLQPTSAVILTETLATSISTGACPTETADLKLFTNTKDGYCLLYPAENTILPPALIVINPTGLPGDMPGDAWVQISVEDALGLTAAQVADQKIAEVGEGFNITHSEILIDGKQAVVVDGLPGQDAWRGVFIVDNNHLYTISFMPWDPNADGFSQLENLYSSVIDSFHFLPPTP